MRYWWVNQNQTHSHEIGGGYLWSPKRSSNDKRNPYYESMREIAPGDLVFSFVDTRIIAIGKVISYCYENPKPGEFGAVGQNWAPVGWRVRVDFSELVRQIRPREHMDLLANLLPPKYSPLLPDGRGVQSVYLTELPTMLAECIIGIIGQEAMIVQAQAASPLGQQAWFARTGDVEIWEYQLERDIDKDVEIPETDRKALIVARRGQGIFRQRVSAHERECRVTRVSQPAHLRASHCKPWRDSTNEERLDGENGLMLTPTVDHLFDEGFISFEDSGDLILSPVAHKPSLVRMGITVDQPFNVGTFSSGQKHYLDYHRNSVLRRISR